MGGMGIVYRAHDTVTGESVAIKILLPELHNDEVSIARFRQEAALGAQLAHPNVCHVTAVGVTAQGLDFVAMPLLTGDSLWDRTAHGEQLPLDVTARIVHDVADGLHVAHELGIVHRDLKPENIIIVGNPDGSERAVLLDFGLAAARALGPSRPKLTRTGMVVGTPEFMSPEQIRALPLDRRSDIYALAFMAYEMLTGQLPFAGTTMRELAVARLKGELIPARTHRPDLPAAVDKVLARALAVAPQDRYDTAPAFASAFTEATNAPSRSGIWGWIHR